MANRKAVHTVPRNGGWENVVNGRSQGTTHRTKEVAVDRGRGIARQQEAEHVIHKKDGTIGSSNSYGGDPNPPKDKR